MEKNIENNAVRDIVDDAQKKKYHNWLLIPHIIIFIWATLFVYSVFSYPVFLSRVVFSGIIITIGQIFLLFISIPLAILSFVFIAKKRVGKYYIVPLIVLAVLNMILSILDWIVVIILANY
ncbi:MAG: hypothetical protein IJI19_05430 [Ruminococcus sp.]|nr:hypothetical protein [Ruminococcus sp.]